MTWEDYMTNKKTKTGQDKRQVLEHLRGSKMKMQ